MYALEKLWKAAYVFHAEGSLEADLWVLDRTLRILSGGVGQVVKGLRQSITLWRLLSGAKQQNAGGSRRLPLPEPHPDALSRIPRQGLAHRQWSCRRRLQEPDQGPEERSGMRWTEQMAEAIVQLRAIYLSGDFNDYWHFHIEQDQKRLYPEAWTVVPK